ncbi:MAG: hypothetical protein JNJ47_01945, partial [Alphaproteobacteria bacterium]|nr:hypothetical protein [Alphaproteobacteria bacterium]
MIVGTLWDQQPLRSRAYRWTPHNHMELLDSFDMAFSVSADGSSIIGASSSKDNPDHLTPLLLVGSKDVKVLADLNSIPNGLSSDGSIVMAEHHKKEAPFSYEINSYLYFPNGAIEFLKPHPEEKWSRSSLLSTDGSMCVGHSGGTSNLSRGRACSWTKRGQNVKALSEELAVLEPLDLSYDGSAIVGYQGELYATQQQSMQMREDQTRAFLWTSKEGKKLIQDFLAQKGELLPGLTLTQAAK